jgi:hypothetical protein
MELSYTNIMLDVVRCYIIGIYEFAELSMFPSLDDFVIILTDFNESLF